MKWPKKLQEMVLYAYQFCEEHNMPCCIEKALLIAFQADCEHYVKHGRSISRCKWFKGDQFPIPSSWRRYLK